MHAINRHFHEALSLRIDASVLEEQPQQEGTLHILEGRLNNAPAAGDSLAPAGIQTESIRIEGDRIVVKLPARSVTVVEVPLQ